MAESDLSSEVNAVTVLPAATGLSASESNGDVDLSWTNNDDSTDGGQDVERAEAPEWSYLKAITIDSTKVDADLTDFPVLVHLDSDDDLASHAQSSGDDIKFEDANGNQLSHEIEKYDGGTGTLTAHVKVPTVSSSSDTTIYIYYGNSNANNQESVTDTWDSDYGGVWHFNETSGDALDSTANNNDGAVDAGIEQGQSGLNGPAYRFDDAGDIVEITGISSQLNFTDTFTITVVVEIEQDQRYPRFISRGGANAEFDLLQWTSHFSWRMNGGTDFKNFPDLGTHPKWYVASYIYDNNNDSFKYIDDSGSVADTRSGTVQLNTGGNNLEFGAVNDAWSAKLSQIEISDVVRSDAWVATENRNKNDPLSFYTVGAQESKSYSFTDLATGLSPSTTSYTDTTVASGTTYKYRIERNTDHATETSGTASVSTSPAAPSNLSVLQGSEDQLDLTWKDNATTEDGFYVYRAESSGSTTADYTQIADLSADTTSYTDTSLEDGEKYFYRVSAYNTDGESTLSNEGNAITSLPASSNLSLSTLNEDSFDVSWTNNDDSSDGDIEVFVNGTGDGSLTTSSTSDTYTGLSDGTTYDVFVRRSTDHISSDSGTSTISTPVQPSSITVSSSKEGELDVSWDDVSIEDGYVIYRSQSSGVTTSDTKVATPASNTTSYTDTGLEDGELYYYGLTSTKSGYETSISVDKSATTILPTPSNLSFDNSVDGELTISWTKNDNSLDGSVEIERAPLVGTDWSTIASGLSSDTTSYTDTSINDSDEYKYRINRSTDHSTVTNQKVYKFYPRVNIV